MRLAVGRDKKILDEKWDKEKIDKVKRRLKLFLGFDEVGR